MEKKSNHYVPQFYLRNFSKNKSIGVFNIKHSKYVKEASIKKQACKDYLYGEDSIIEDTLAEIEGLVSQIIKQISTTEIIPEYDSEEYQLLLLFMLLSEARNLKSAESFNNMIDTQMKTIIRMKMAHGQLPELSPEFVNETKIKVDIPNLQPIQIALTTFPILFDLKCCLIVNKSDRLFITSDNPLVKYNLMYIKRKYRLRGYGLGNMGVQLFFPITPRLCICVFDDVLYDHDGDDNGNIVVNKGNHIDELNKLFYLNSYETLFFDQRLSENYIRRIVDSADHYLSEIENEVMIFGSSEEKLIQYSQRKVDHRIHLPMFTINRNFVNMPLPPHLGGPIRPYAKEYMDREKENEEEIK